MQQASLTDSPLAAALAGVQVCVPSAYLLLARRRRLANLALDSAPPMALPTAGSPRIGPPAPSAMIHGDGGRPRHEYPTPGVTPSCLRSTRLRGLAITACERLCKVTPSGSGETVGYAGRLPQSRHDPPLLRLSRLASAPAGERCRPGGGAARRPISKEEDGGRISPLSTRQRTTLKGTKGSG